jgi:hypothetical protein
MECKNASNESLSESADDKRLEGVREEEALLERFEAVAVWSVSSSYIIESAGVNKKEGAANNNPPVANFLPLESLVRDALPGGRQLLVTVAELLLIAEDVAERMIFIVEFICVYIKCLLLKQKSIVNESGGLFESC